MRFKRDFGYEDLSEYLYLYLLECVDKNMPENLSPNDRHYLEGKDMDETFFSNVSSNMDEMISNPQAFLTKHRECMEEYKKVTASDEFRASPAFRLREALTKLNSENGYNDVLIPAMKKLSPAYRAYHEELQKANELFLRRI